MANISLNLKIHDQKIIKKKTEKIYDLWVYHFSQKSKFISPWHWFIKYSLDSKPNIPKYPRIWSLILIYMCSLKFRNMNYSNTSKNIKNPILAPSNIFKSLSKIFVTIPFKIFLKILIWASENILKNWRLVDKNYFGKIHDVSFLNFHLKINDYSLCIS